MLQVTGGKTTVALVSSPTKPSHKHSKPRTAAGKSSKHSKDKENRQRDASKLNNLQKPGGEGKNNLECEGGGGRVPQNGVTVVGGSGEISSTEQKQLVELVQRNMDRHHRQLKKVRWVVKRNASSLCNRIHVGGNNILI